MAALGAVVLGATSAGCNAAEWDVSLDLRAVDSSSRNSYFDGGQSKLRYDADDNVLQLGRFRAALTQALGEVFAAHAEMSSWGDDSRNPIDLTEAFVEYRPYPRAGFRTRVRLGTFYPPMSLENRATGWETPYTLTPSAISSWIGQEVRTVGLETQMDWLGTRRGHSLDLQLTGAVFGWNDPAGTLLATYGWALTDRQTGFFGLGAERRADLATKNELFHEIDGRAGYYLGGQARYLDRAVLNVLHYDNRGDPEAFSPSLQAYAWDTKFDAAALRVETGNGWTAIVQALSGKTSIAPGGFLLNWDFRSHSAELAKRHGPHMLAARYDDFEVVRGRRGRSGSESGSAWTVAYSFDRGAQWRFMLEWLRVRSNVASRPALLAEPALASETQLQLAARYAISGSF